MKLYYFLFTFIVIILCTHSTNDVECNPQVDELLSQEQPCTDAGCCWFEDLGCDDCTPSPTSESSTVVEIIGDTCYCSTSEENEEGEGEEPSTPNPTIQPTPAPVSKKTSSKDSSGNGYGDCDCDKDYGLIELRMRNEVNFTVTRIDFYYDGYTSDIICNYTNLARGGEFICNIVDYVSPDGTTYGDFDTNTYFYMYIDSLSGVDITCGGKFHTSCSSDIVGTYSTEEGSGYDYGYLCDKIYCTGWKDGNPFDNNTCDDGMVECECTPTPGPTSSPILPIADTNSPTSDPTADTDSPTHVPTDDSNSPTHVPTDSTLDPTLAPTVFACTNVDAAKCHQHQDICCVIYNGSNHYCDDIPDAMDSTSCASCSDLYDYGCYEWDDCCTYNDEVGNWCGNRAESGVNYVCDVTSSPTTAAPTTADPTHEPTTTEPTSNPADPTRAPTTTEPTSNPTTADPTRAPTTADPTHEPTTTEPTSNPTTADPTRAPTPTTTTTTTTTTDDTNMGGGGTYDGTDDGTADGANAGTSTDNGERIICHTFYLSLFCCFYWIVFY